MSALPEILEFHPTCPNPITIRLDPNPVYLQQFYQYQTDFLSFLPQESPVYLILAEIPGVARDSR
jgi:hypothetical protein